MSPQHVYTIEGSRNPGTGPLRGNPRGSTTPCLKVINIRDLVGRHPAIILRHHSFYSLHPACLQNDLWSSQDTCARVEAFRSSSRLILSLHLVVGLDGFGIGRRSSTTVTTSAASGLGSGRRRARRSAAVVPVRSGAVVAVRGSALRLGLGLRLAVHKDVRHATLLAVLARHALVLVVAIGELGNDVPGVDEAGDLCLVLAACGGVGDETLAMVSEGVGAERETYEAEHAKQNVDDGVGGADAALNPD